MIDYKYIKEKYNTPLFVYDIDTLHERIKYLKSKFNKSFNFAYAVKANTFIIKEADSLVERFEICSQGEYEICKKLNISRNKMVISGVNKDKDFIEELISKYDDICKYTVESYTQYELLNELSKKYNRNIDVLIRLTSGNQFGVSEECLLKIIKEHDNSHLNITGIEFFAGTEKHSLAIIEKDINHINELVNTIENDLGFEIKEIEYGPGLPVFYFQSDSFDEDSYLSDLNKLIEKFGNKIITLEVGRSIAASCGSYLTSVVDIKDNKNGNFVILDGGINHLVYYGQMMAMKVPHFEVIENNNKEKVVYNLCGSLCTTNDLLIKNIELNELSIGDTFIFKNSGAYSSTEGIALFLSRELPKVVLIKDNKDILVRNNDKTSVINCPNYEEE